MRSAFPPLHHFYIVFSILSLGRCSFSRTVRERTVVLLDSGFFCFVPVSVPIGVLRQPSETSFQFSGAVFRFRQRTHVLLWSHLMPFFWGSSRFAENEIRISSTAGSR